MTARLAPRIAALGVCALVLLAGCAPTPSSSASPAAEQPPISPTPSAASSPTARARPTAMPSASPAVGSGAGTPMSSPTLLPTPQATQTPAGAADVLSVDAGDYFFAPAQVSVAVGTTVTWKNVGVEAHDVVARDGSFKSTTMGVGERFTFTFTKPGRYPYLCTFHEGDGMFGEVDVK